MENSDISYVVYRSTHCAAHSCSFPMAVGRVGASVYMRRLAGLKHVKAAGCVYMLAGHCNANLSTVNQTTCRHGQCICVDIAATKAIAGVIDIH